MDKDTGHNRQYIKRNHTRTEEKEEYSEDRSRPASTTITEKTKHQRRFKRTLTHNIINLSRLSADTWRNITTFQRTKLYPNTQKRTPSQTSTKYPTISQKIDIEILLLPRLNNWTTTNWIKKRRQYNNDILHPSSGWTPLSGQGPFLQSYRSTIIHNTSKEIKKKNNKKFKRNLKKEEWTAISTLRNNRDIVIKPADKGGNIVIMNKQDYIQEGLRQISDSNHYEILEEDPTQTYNNQLYQVLQQATNLNTIDDKIKKTLYNKAPRTPNFYMLPKRHKQKNPGRPIVNGIGSITEKISVYVDQQIRHLVPRIPSYLKDTIHLIHILLGKKLAPEDILVAIDWQSLYTNIPHPRGIQALNRILEETNTDPMKKLLICRLANLVLTKNYFSFNNILYRQIQGTAMGTRMAPSYANTCMKYAETQLIDTSPKKPKLWLSFIDDIFMIWGHGRYALEDFKHLANNIHPTIKFSFNSNEQEIPFLDTIIYRGNNNYILTRLYHTPTDNKQYLHFNSAHPWKQKN